MDTNIKITSREKGLQILYWLEDKGIDANFSQWNENSYYFNFNDERDYNNALILLNEYCGKDSIRYDDYSRMEIEVDVDKAYPRLVDNVNSKYMGEYVNEEINNEDSITEELLEADKVEDDLEDIIRDTIEENKNENSKISLFEITTEPENPTREKDEEKMYVVDFDDMKTDFRKLTIYPYNEEKPYAPVASFMLSGGLNGSGNWTNYLDDLQKLFEKLKETTGLEPLIYEESTDIADDVWDAKVFMYDHNKDDEEENSLDEGLFDVEPQEIERTNVSDSSKNKDLKKLIIFWKDNPFYGRDERDLTWINSNTIRTANWDSAKREGNHVVWNVNNKGNLIIYSTSYYEPEKRNSSSNFVLDGEYYERGSKFESVNKYLEILKHDAEVYYDQPIIIRDEYNENLKDEPLEEGLFDAPLSYTFNVGDTFTTPIDFEDEAFVADTTYEIVELDDGKYGLYYENLDHPNVSFGSGYVDNFEADTLEELSEMIFEYDPHISKEMINRDEPYESYEIKISHNSNLEKLIDFWNDENVGNFKLDWLDENTIRTLDTYSGDRTPDIWKINPNNNHLKLINGINNQLRNEWNSVEDYINEYKKLNGDLEDEDLDEDYIDETYSKDELDSFKNKVFNQQKVMSIYKKKKYGKKRLMCRVKCTNCGRQKKLFLSNLVTNPEKYGSCICSDKNINARYDTINGLYKGTKKLRNNTSGYTGVSWVAKYAGEPYNKWRAYIDIDGQRNYLGDFSSKSKAIRARKAAAAKGLKWYAENKDQFMATSRRNRKRKRKLKNKKSTTA